MKVLIVSVVYLEPEWEATRVCIETVKLLHPDEIDVVYIDRKGYGSLSEAFNKGFGFANKEHLAVWFVTNVTFSPDSYRKLLVDLINYSLAAVHPAFNSDHPHLRPDSDLPVPYIEFTAPLVRADVFEKFPLDEQMPYWGMDLDWSYRVTQAGYNLGCCRDVGLGHEYIRNNVKAKPLKVTRRRWAERKRTDASTTARLVKKYGKDWRNVLNYK